MTGRPGTRCFAIVGLSQREILQDQLFVISQSCEMQDCQWNGVKRIKLCFCEKAE